MKDKILFILNGGSVMLQILTATIICYVFVKLLEIITKESTNNVVYWGAILAALIVTAQAIAFSIHTLKSLI